MFAPTSRYYNLETATLNFPHKRDQIIYVRRRFLPQRKENQSLGQLRVNERERLDLIAAKTLGNPELFWRICDANEAMNPTELTADLDRELLIPLSQF